MQMFSVSEKVSRGMTFGSSEEQQKEKTVCMVIMERGASWPVFAADLQRGTGGSLVEVQADEESYRQFSMRVQRRVQSLAQGGQSVQVIIVAASRDSEPSDAGRRTELVSKVARKMAADGELFLTAQCGESDVAIRTDLFELAGAVCEKEPVSVRVRFSEMADSGVRWSVKGSRIPPAPKAPLFTEEELLESQA
ncbi:MAG: hypothetical protein SFV15_08180 [Polyangiaceae bacterium]|nr:hypothetical protein [Polyangiaceae bacterium]